MAIRDEKGRFKKENPFEANKYEIIYNLINSALAGALVFVGAIADGKVSAAELMVVSGAAGIVALIKFKEYWTGEEKEYQKKLFQFW